MDRKGVDAINTERMRGWRKTLGDNHSTVMVAIGVGHDHRSGELHLLVPDDDDVVGAIPSLLAWALRKVTAGDAIPVHVVKQQDEPEPEYVERGGLWVPGQPT